MKEKDPKDYKLVGKPVARLDIPDKLTGKFTYMQDFRVPGMLHGRVARPAAPSWKSVDESSIKDVPGIVKVMRDGDFLAVVAANEWAAIRGARELKATWSKAETLPDQAKLWDYVRATKVVKDQVTSNVGNTAEARRKDGAKSLKATYDFAIPTHGSIGPSCAVAEFKDGKLTSWSASQATDALRGQLAQMCSLSPENVRCFYVEGAGCYAVATVMRMPQPMPHCSPSWPRAAVCPTSSYELVRSYVARSAMPVSMSVAFSGAPDRATCRSSA